MIPIKKEIRINNKISPYSFGPGLLVPGCLVLWSLGPLVPWSPRPLVPLAPWSSGSLVLWSLGPLVPWSSGPSSWSLGPWVCTFEARRVKGDLEIWSYIL